MVRLVAAASVVLLGVAVLAAPVRASTVSISGTLSGSATFTPTGSPAIFLENVTGDGDDTAYGSFTHSSQLTVDFSSPSNFTFSDGTFTEVFTNGTLFGTGSGDGTADGLGGTTFTIDFVVTGGTGFFAGDTGQGTETGTGTTTSSTTASAAASYTGTLTTTPLPATWLMLLSGFVGLGFFVYRGTKKRSTAMAAA